MVYHRILNIVPCAIQYDLIVYPSDLYWFASVNPQSPIFPSPTSFPPWQPQVRSLHLWVCFCFVNMFICVIFQIPHKSDSILFLTSLSMIISRSIHVASNDIISSFLMAEQYSIVYMYHIFFIHFYWWTFRLLLCFGYYK